MVRVFGGKQQMETCKENIKELELHKKNPDYKTDKKQIFIIGSKGIPAKYGGFESFVERLTLYQKSKDLRYHVACLSKKYGRFEYNGAKCFGIKVPKLGAAKAIYYDIAAMKWCIRYCKARPSIKAPIFYILACRIGPFIGYFKRQINKLGGHIYVNPDGHEWKRDKWNKFIKKYWKFSERLMVKHAELIICDSKNIEAYIKSAYIKYKPKTTFIAYGSDIAPSSLADTDKKITEWYEKQGVKPNEYYLIVGRFVPENNYETIIREFIKSATSKKLVIITNTSYNPFFQKLMHLTGFDKDNRIKFAGTVYDQDLLKKIRENAFAYIHGHEVGGTNPSLLEALASTKLNLLLDVGFNREVGQNAALYWNKNENNLSDLIIIAEKLADHQLLKFGCMAKKRIQDEYSWDYISKRYEEVFHGAENYSGVEFSKDSVLSI